MAVNAQPRAEGQPPDDGTGDENVATLIRELVRDTTELFRQELNLARLEMRESVTGAVSDAVKLILALGLALLGGLCLAVFSILGIGRLLGGEYWAGALITAGALILVGGALTGAAVSGMKKRRFGPQQTVETLRLTAQDAKRALRGNGSKTQRIARGEEEVRQDAS